MNTRYVLVQAVLGQGCGLAERDGEGRVVLYPSRREAEAEVARTMRDQYSGVLDGERALDDVATPDLVEAVELHENGDIADAAGHVIANISRPLPFF